MFALIVTGSEQRSGAKGNRIFGEEGAKYWVTMDYWGPTSSRVDDPTRPPRDSMMFATREDAEKFSEAWAGHPWWCKPIKGKHKIVEVRGRFEMVPAGYEAVA